MFRFGCVRLGIIVLGLGLCVRTVGAQEDPRLDLLSTLVRDPSPKVRVDALRGLARIPTARAAELALGVLEMPMDPKLDYALWLTLNDLAEPWIAAVTSGAWKPAGREGQLAFALRSLKPEQVGRVLAAILGSQPLPADGSGPWIEAIGAAGAASHAGRLLDQAATGGFQDAALVQVFQALVQAARLRQVLPAGDPARLDRFLGHPDAAVRVGAIRLAGLWKQERHVDALVAGLTASPSPTPSERGLRLDALRQIGSAAVRAALARLVGEGVDPGLRRGAAVTLASLDALQGFPAVVATASTVQTEAEALEFWRAALAIKGAALPLREALAERTLPPVAAKAGIRASREGGREDLELVEAFGRAGGLASEGVELTQELIREVASRALAKGDPNRGERVFRRADLACTTCHAIGGAGGKVGPDMTSIGASAPMDYLVESLLLPSAKIKEGYHAVQVETRDGEEVSGTVARETQEELFLRTVSGQEVAVPKKSITRRETGRLSLMPSGLLEPASEQDRVDLLAFLGRLGKPGEFDASKGGVARRWFLANIVHTDQQNNDADWFWKRPLDDKRWAPILSLANGSISRDLLDETLKAQAWTSKIAVVAATEIEQAAAGTVHFRVVPAAAELWVSGRKVGSGPDLQMDLPVGRHRVVLRLDPQRMPESLRLEAEGTAFPLQ